MRIKLAAVVLLSVAVAASCRTSQTAGAAAHSLQGNWELVSARYTRANGETTEVKAPQLRSLKVIGPSRFAFITVREDGSLARAAGGRYRIEGNKYIETIDYTSASHMRGDYVFDWRIEGDLWYHTGTHEGVRFEEVWQRAQ